MVHPLKFREIVGVSRNDITMIEAVGTGATDGKQAATLYFTAGSDSARVAVANTTEERARFTIGGGLVLRVVRPVAEPVAAWFGNELVELEPTAPETDRFAGHKVIAAQRNGEDAASIIEWLAYHRDTQGMTAAVILDRTAPGEEGIGGDLKARLAAMDTPPLVTFLRSHLPLGKPELPAESHPYCAPDAPGKERMDLPPADPWRSPLLEMTVFEILRERFLGRATAVASLEVNDLVVAEGSTTVFEKAAQAPNGVIDLLGTPCYPWRLRPNATARFADHTCVQFDGRRGKRRWCIVPARAPENAVWRLARVGHARADPTRSARFFSFMGLRHSPDAVAQIVPKTALIENDELLDLSRSHFGHKPVRVPKVKVKPVPAGRGRRTIVTTMKNEGPFILEWLAHHRAIGVDDFLIYTNDCTDGTDDMLRILQDRGLVQHRENPYRQSGMKPQHAALAAAQDEPMVDAAKWLVCIDVDEFINVKCGDGSLDALFAAVPDANMISMTWRLFGNSDVGQYVDVPVVRQFTCCAPELTRKPHVAWGFKTLFQNRGIFKKMGVHRPKGLQPSLLNEINWVNGSGQAMPRSMYRNAWRSTLNTVGYDLVQLNHYAVRSAESFLVKRDRGRVNHVDRDQGLAYWFRMNNNAATDRSIQRGLSALEAELARLKADSEIAEAHETCVACHRVKIDELLNTKKFGTFYEELTGARLQRLSLMHRHFGTNVFLTGPNCVPDEVIQRDLEEDFFFTVPMNEAVHG